MKINSLNYLLFFFLIGFLPPGYAQDNVVRCYTMEADQALREQYPEMGTLDDFEEWLAPRVRAYKESAQARAVQTLPVVFHIVHNGGSDNISATYINAQIDQLNNDFRRILGTSGYNTDSRGADTELEFCPATVDPNGSSMAEPGINRINRSTQGWTAPPYSQSYIDGTIKPQSIWDPNDYVNIWVMQLSGGLLGYAQFPSQSGLSGLNTNGGPASTDGVVVLFSSVGSSTTPFPGGAPFNEGRTLTHELGHFFGLRHIWGDANCGNDYCADTPQASGPASGCPNKTTCDGQRDMVENYMDYSSDGCMNIFTNDQNARIQTVMANSPRRGSLSSSAACSGGGGGGGGLTCGTTVSSFPYSEGWESSFGAWTQATNDDFNWARRSGSTPSSNTGPSGAAEGSTYAYVEASSPNYSNKTTILNSPCLDLSGASTANFSFQYHLYGASAMGNLYLEASTDGSSWSIIWSRLGNQGNQWFNTSVDLGAYLGETVQLRFRGVTGTTWQGDMAIDDLSFSTSTGGGGGGISCSTTISSFPYSESWESSFGSWSQAGGDDFDWARRSGTTPSSNTGPSSAFQGSVYAYVEASSPNYPNKTTILNGPCFDLSGLSSPAFDFNYHLYGASAMGSLYLEATTNGSSWTTIWSQSGNQGNQWFGASADLSAYAGGTVQLRFRGVTGTTWQGDMAIDALSLTDGGGGGGGCSTVTLTINLDNYPEETSWQITDGGGSVVASGGTYAAQPDGSTVVETECLTDGCYNFTIFDSYGDGICCAYGSGSYSLTDSGGGVLASGGAFASSETTNFCLSGGNRTLTGNAGVVEQREGPSTALECFPNPTRGVLNVRFAAKEDANVQLRIVDLLGRTLSLTEWMVAEGKNQQQMDVSAFEGGTYLLLIETETNRFTQRFVVLK